MIIPLYNRPVSFSGHPLAGDKLVRFIYMDEAGTSANEPVAVVAGTIINADKQWRILESYRQEIVNEYIPAEDRDGFCFHATELFSGSGYFDRSRWKLSTRLEILKALLSARPKFGVSVSIGFAFRKEDETGQGHADLRHILAYSICLVGCERYLRDFGEPGEVAKVVAEDVPDIRRKLRQLHHDLISPNPEIPGGIEFFRQIMPLRHIVDGVHFEDKAYSSLLQFADAFAFALRRHLGGYSHSGELMEVIAGPDRLMGFGEGGRAGAGVLASIHPKDASKNLPGGWIPSAGLSS